VKVAQLLPFGGRQAGLAILATPRVRNRQSRDTVPRPRGVQRLRSRLQRQEGWPKSFALPPKAPWKRDAPWKRCLRVTRSWKQVPGTRLSRGLPRPCSSKWTPGSRNITKSYDDDRGRRPQKALGLGSASRLLPGLLPETW